MQRRTYVSAVAASLCTVAGCSASRALPDGGRPADRTVAEAAATTGTTADVSLSATVDRRQITDQQTAAVTLGVTWEGSDPETLTFGNRLPFDYPAYSEDDRVLLLPAAIEHERQSGAGWVPKTDENGDIPVKTKAVSSSFDPGESRSETWTVWANPGETEYVPTGEYEFTGTVTVGTRSSGVEQVPFTVSLSIDSISDQ